MTVTAKEFDLAVRAYYGASPGRIDNHHYVDISGWNNFTTLIQKEGKVFLPIGSVEVMERTDFGIIYRLTHEDNQQYFMACVYLAKFNNPEPPPKETALWVGNLVELFPS